jgi:Protein kinase domain
MRYVRGRTLAEVLFDTRSLVERLRFLPAIVATANALGYAHARGVIHRDVKPANVLLGSHGETILLDWGLGKLRGLSLPEPEGEVQEGTETRDGAGLGTPSYMAPEQARGELSAMDERTDVFALGAMLYHLLTGKPPYEAGHAEDIIQAAAACLPRPIRALEPQAPLGLVGICTRAMQANPEDRYPNAVAFAEAIQAAQAAALLPAPPAQVRQRTAGVVATGALLFIGVILIATRVGAPLASQGIGVWAVLAFSVPVFLLQGLDWYFGERWPFRNLSRGLMVAALAGGLSVSVSNVVATLETVGSAEGASLTLLLLSSWISWERERR